MKPKLKLVNDHVIVTDPAYYTTEASQARWVRDLVSEFLPEVKRDLRDLEGERLPVSELCVIVRETLDQLNLICAGLGDGSEEQRKFLDRVKAGGYAEIRAKLLRVGDMASRQLAQHEAKGALRQ